MSKILARFTIFVIFMIFGKFLRISKIATVNFEIHSFLFICSKYLFSSDTNSCSGKLNLGYKLKDFSAMHYTS